MPSGSVLPSSRDSSRPSSSLRARISSRGLLEDVVALLRRRARPGREGRLGGGDRRLGLRARAAHGFADDILGVGRIDVRRACAVGQPFAVDQTVEHQHGCTPCWITIARSGALCATRRNPSASARRSRDRGRRSSGPSDLFGNEILERRHLDGLVGDLVGEVRGDHDHAVAVAENDVAGKHRRIAAADRHVDVDRLMQGEVGRRAGRW